METIIQRLKDLKTSVPGIVVNIYAIVSILKELGIEINLTEKMAFNLALLAAGIGLMLSGGMVKKEGNGNEK